MRFEARSTFQNLRNTDKNAAIPISKLASAHVDDAEAGPDVRTAADALDAADAGDDDARFAVDGAEGHELAWYATQELSYLAE